MPLAQRVLQMKLVARGAARLHELFAARCCAPDCPQRQTLWPTWLRRATSVEFDSNWYCGPECLNRVLEIHIHNLFAGHVAEKPKTYRHTLGALLVNRGVISRDNLREALCRQRTLGSLRLGRCLREMHLISEEQLVSALGQQWGCPVFPLIERIPPFACIDLLPLHLLESARAVPAYVSGKGSTVHIAFGDRLDHTMLYAVGVMLGCRTVACVAPEAAVTVMLDKLRRASSGNEACFDTIREPAEIARTICSYAGQLHATRVSMVRVGGFLWARFHRGRSSRDLLFRLVSENAPSSTELTIKIPGHNSVSTELRTEVRKDGVPQGARNHK
jgi:Type II secretion system (T2SS), protein E, N-terminal domain